MLPRLRRAVSEQFSRPSGAAGRVIAAAMNHGNRGLNDRAIDLLDVGPGSRVLDLGFGGGLSFAPLLARGATVVGVDRAEDMVAAARTRHAGAVADGRLALHSGDVGGLPLGEGAVDRVLTVNTVYFWPDLDAALREVRRVLVPEGRLAVGIRDGTVMQRADPAVFTIRSPGAVATALGAAGFVTVEHHPAPDGRTHVLTATAPGR